MATEEVTISLAQMQQLQKDCEHKIELKECLERLMKHQDFQTVFLTEYCKNEPERLVHLLADPALAVDAKRDVYRADIHDQMVGIAKFSAYMRTVFQLAEQAQHTLDELAKAVQ